MKCDTCLSFAAKQRYYKNKNDGMYCSECYVKYLTAIRKSYDNTNSEEDLESEASYLMDLRSNND
jgi:hypothetical protein